MSALTQARQSTVPFLFEFAVARTGENDTPGRYDPAMMVWVIDGPSCPTPIIDAATTTLVELATKTDVVRERDDPGLSLIDLATRTAVQSEHDDFQNASLAYALHLETTTKVNSERVDFDSDSYQ
jgi:hypothetical protein